MATKAQLITKVLSSLNVTPAGQPDSAEDVAVVEAAIPGFMADLQLRGVYYISDIDDTPDQAFLWLAMILAQHVASDFGGQIDLAAMELATSRLHEQQNLYLPSQAVMMDDPAPRGAIVCDDDWW